MAKKAAKAVKLSKPQPVKEEVKVEAVEAIEKEKEADVKDIKPVIEKAQMLIASKHKALGVRKETAFSGSFYDKNKK